MAYGLLLGKHAKYYAPLRNLELVALEYYDVGAPDIGAQLTNIVASNPDVVVVFAIEQTCCLAMKQLRERGMDKPIVGNGPIVATTLQEAFKGVFSIPPYTYCPAGNCNAWDLLPKEHPVVKVARPVATIYEKRYGEKYLGPLDPVIVLQNAVERALSADPTLLDKDVQTVRKALRDKLETTKNVVSDGGTYTMTPEDHNGYHRGSHVAVVHWENGKMLYDEQLTKAIKPLPLPPAEHYK